MSLTPKRRVLGVSPGGRGIGIAGLDGPEELTRFEMTATAASESSRQRGERFRRGFLQILEEERPDVVVLEAIDGSRRTLWTTEASRVARELAKERGVSVVAMPLDDARTIVAGGGHRTRIETHRTLAGRWPQLGRCTKQPLHSRFYGYTDQYWERPFAALTLAVACAGSSEVGSETRQARSSNETVFT